MTADIDEFDLIDEVAESLGVVSPFDIRRETHDASGVSTLVWGDSPSAVLLHGGGLNAHTWDATLLHLGVSALAVDLPGHGHSRWREDADYRASTAAANVAAAIAGSLEGRRVPVIGQSLGGATGIALAAQRPDLISGLVLVDVSPGLRPGDAGQVRDFLAGPTDFASRDEIVQRAEAAGLGGDRASLVRGVALNTRIRDDGRVAFRHHLAALPAGAPDVAGDFAALWQPLLSLEVPVLLVRGRTGFLSDEAVEEFRERLPLAEVVEVDSGHNVQEQRPAELAKILRSFLTRTGGDRG